MLKHISWKQPQLRSSGPRNGFNGSHYTQVTWSRTTSSRGYIHVDLCHLFHFLRILSFRVRWMKARFFGTSRCPISPVAREESAITKMGKKKAWKVEIPRWELSRLSVVEKTIEMGSRLLHPPLQKFRQFSSNAREPCLPSLRAMCCLVAASLKCDTIPISTYWDDLSATSRWR